MGYKPTKPLRILYAIQGTGNGHVARALEIVPILQEFGDLKILLSGDQSQVELPFKVDYRSRGLTFIYNKKGGLSYSKTILKNNLLRIFNEIKAFPIHDFDLIINDFEFITAWACKLKGKPCFALGHQAAFRSKRVPRPKWPSLIGEGILRHYAPCSQGIGFHFKPYDRHIYEPVIRKEIRELSVSHESNHFTVYLPAYGDEYLNEILSKIPQTNWEVFSKQTKRERQMGHVHFKPISSLGFAKSMSSGKGLLSSAGFESPAEALFLGKKLCVVPIKGQYEQYCNAAALAEMNQLVIWKLDKNSIEILQKWVNDPMPNRIYFPNKTRELLSEHIFGNLNLE